jgi:hypothetical protein
MVVIVAGGTAVSVIVGMMMIVMIMGVMVIMANPVTEPKHNDPGGSNIITGITGSIPHNHRVRS